jgi:putative membrane protein
MDKSTARASDPDECQRPVSCMFLVLSESKSISSPVESGDRSTANDRSRREPLLLLAVGLVLLVISGIHPKDRFTWVLEVAPIFVAVPVLVATARRFPLTPLAYRLIFLHALILMAGGHYTYAEVPLGFWARDLLGLARNHYDRLGHFAQGFVPAILAREVLRRRLGLAPGGWLFFLVTCICLSVSAAYEMIEWLAAVTTGEAAMAFLGTQGDVWDTQWDMLTALLGAITAQLLLSRRHERELQSIRAHAAGE